MKLFGRKQKLKLKVLRNELAKEFPLIHIAKRGDVGLDIPAVLPYVDGYETNLKNYLDDCDELDEAPDEKLVSVIKHGSITIHPGQRFLVPTGIKIEIPSGYWASIEARSSTSKQSLIVPKGVIDEGYRGELFAQVLNVGHSPVVIYHGDRLIQLIVHKREIEGFVIEEVDELSKSERGETGFGSTGQSEYNKVDEVTKVPSTYTEIKKDTPHTAGNGIPAGIVMHTIK